MSLDRWFYLGPLSIVKVWRRGSE